MRRILPLLLGIALLTGCGLHPASQFLPAVVAGPALHGVSLKGATLTVSSKNFSEQVVLGKITGLALGAAGADVVDKTNAAGSMTHRNQLVRGDADLGWEYTGTAWVTYLGNANPIPDARAQYDAVRDADLAKNKLAWLDPAPFNNTYTMAVTKDNAAKYGLKSLADMAKVPVAERTFCVESEFSTRNDGLEGMLKAYGVPLGSAVPAGNIKKMDTGVIYDATHKGTCTFGEVFDTDGRIEALHLVTLTDDKKFFPVYNPCLVVRAPVLAKYPQLATVFNEIAKRLDTATMRQLNARVDVTGEEPVYVARDWLTAQGFLKS